MASRLNTLHLPLILTKENKMLIGGVWFLIAASLYLAANHFHFVEPHLLPMTFIDQTTPLIPETFWIYISDYLYFYVVYLVCKDEVNLNRYIYSFLALQVTSVLIFWAWPTTYPRNMYPLPENIDSVTYWAFSHFRHLDSPASCCPSLHVSSVYLSAFLFLNEQREKFKYFFIWGSMIAVSTLTTKQHYIIDVVTGFMLATVIFWIFDRKVNYFKVALAKR